jgi:hypothetical protein
LWAAVRALEEKAALQRRVAEGATVDPRGSTRLLDQSSSDFDNARRIRNIIFRGDAKLNTKAAALKKKSAPRKRKAA